jgi:hypothetical protein
MRLGGLGKLNSFASVQELEAGLSITDFIAELVDRGRFPDAIDLLVKVMALCELRDIEPKTVAQMSLKKFNTALNMPLTPPEFDGYNFVWGKSVYERASSIY